MHQQGWAHAGRSLPASLLCSRDMLSRASDAHQKFHRSMPQVRRLPNATCPHRILRTVSAKTAGDLRCHAFLQAQPFALCHIVRALQKDTRRAVCLLVQATVFSVHHVVEHVELTHS
jgi:hypothetical protein